MRTAQNRNRLSGWMRTEAVARFARLELTAIEHIFSNFIDLAVGAKVSGASDWVKVEAVLDSGDEAYFMPRMILYGAGRAWFTELALEELRN